MARRTETVAVSLEGRDKGKKFLLTEMPATQAEKWATRAILALGKSGVAVSDDIADAGWGALAAMGVRMLAGVAFTEAEPLLDEMMRQVQIVEPKINRPITDDDIEEVATLVYLRGEVLALHVGFPLGAAISKLSALAPRPNPSPDTATSPPASA